MFDFITHREAVELRQIVGADDHSRLHQNESRHPDTDARQSIARMPRLQFLDGMNHVLDHRIAVPAKAGSAGNLLEHRAIPVDGSSAQIRAPEIHSNRIIGHEARMIADRATIPPMPVRTTRRTMLAAACASALAPRLAGKPSGIRREIFLASPGKGTAVVASAYYTKSHGGEMLSVEQRWSRSDTVDVAFYRFSSDYD